MRTYYGGLHLRTCTNSHVLRKTTCMPQQWCPGRFPPSKQRGNKTTSFMNRSTKFSQNTRYGLLCNVVLPLILLLQNALSIIEKVMMGTLAPSNIWLASAELQLANFGGEGEF